MADVDELVRSLALAKAGLGSPEGARARVRARLAQSLPAADAASSASAALPRVLAGATRARAWTLGLMGLSFVAGYWLRGAQELAQPGEQQRQSATPMVAGAEQGVPASLALDDSPPALQTEPMTPEQALPAMSFAVPPGGKSKAAETKPLQRAVARQGEERAHGSAPLDSLAREVALLQRVERAIRAREGELALALLVEHERSYPASAFREERAAARVLAACVAHQGSVAAAHARVDAERYLAGRVRSVYADRIRTVCEIERGSSSKETQSAGH